MSRTPDDGSGPLDVDAAFAEIVAHWGDDVAAPERPPADRTGSDQPAVTDPDARGAAAGDDAASASEAPGALAAGAPDQAERLEDAADTAGDADDTDRGPRHRAVPGAAPDAAGDPTEDRTRLVRPATPLPPAPREDVPSPEWFATPRQRDDEPAELRALGEERFVPADPAPLPRDVVGWAAWIAVVGAPLFLLVVALGWKDVPQLMTAITAAVFVAGFATLVIRLPSSRDDDDDDGAVV